MTDSKKPAPWGPKSVVRVGRFEFYRDTRGEFRWRLRARNGRVLADCGEGYKRWRPCVRAAWQLSPCPALTADQLLDVSRIPK